MADIIDFSQYAQTPGLDSMDQEGLSAFLRDVRAQIARLDEEEPGDMESEEHEIWGGRHEELEDLVDEILDRLDELD